MKNDIIKKLDEADELVRHQIESANVRMNTSDEEKYSKVRGLIQEAITILHRVS